MRPVQGVLLAMIRAARAADSSGSAPEVLQYLAEALKTWGEFYEVVPDEAVVMYWWELTQSFRGHVSAFTDQGLEVPPCVRAAVRVFLDYDSWANWVTQAELPSRVQDHQPPQAYYESGSEE